MNRLSSFIMHVLVAGATFYMISAMAENITYDTQTQKEVTTNKVVQQKPSKTKSMAIKFNASDETEVAAFKKMSGPEISAYLKAKVRHAPANREDNLVPVVLFSTVPICLFFLFFFRFRTNREKQITLRAMVESGAQIPAEMFMTGSKKDTNLKDRDLRRGFVFSLSSIGFMIFLKIIDGAPDGLWALGLVPFLLGIGYLLSAKLTGNESRQA